MWTNKQHIMSRMVAHYEVIHVDYGLRPLVQYLGERAYYKPSKLLPIHRLFYDGVVQEEGNLHIGDSYSPLWAGAFPHGHKVRDFFSFDAKVLMCQSHLFRKGVKPITWVYHPGFGDAVDRLDSRLLVYDCVDNYEAFPTYRDNPQWLMEREERLCRKADLVFCTSKALYETRKNFNPENTYLVHNVGDAEHFEKAMDPDLIVPEELARLKGPVIGFVGAVSDYKLNIEWIHYAAKARRNWNFVLIGPIGMADPGTEVGDLKDLPNVHLLGHRSYEVLPAYLKGFDVAVIPYRINAYTEAVFPIKFFEFLATGKPVVISALPALEEFYSSVGVAQTCDEFVEWCEAYLEEDGEDARQNRIALAREHSWPERVRKLRERVEERLRQK